MFRKSDLKNGDVICLRMGSIGIVIPDINVIIYPDEFDSLAGYDDDLTNITDNLDRNFDIVEVRRPTEEYECQFCAFEKKLGKVVYERYEGKTDDGGTLGVNMKKYANLF